MAMYSLTNEDIRGDIPQPRFGHTTTQVHRSKIILQGGATGDTGKYSITGDTYSFDIQLRLRKKLDSTGNLYPSPRAAHAACSLEILQLVIQGGASGGGSLASDDLYLLDLRHGDEKISWIIVPVIGQTPGRRYGHTIVFTRPNLIVFAGNTGSIPVNDVWSLNVDKAPFSWVKLELNGDQPLSRVYHSSAVCNTGSANGMMVTFGGRNNDQTALNDTWGLRRHRDGRWDWVKAPYRTNGESPILRYQHSTLFWGSIMIAIGGRTQNVGETVSLEVYDTESSEWFRFNTLQRFRHSCWIIDNTIYIYGGFEPDTPSVPTDVITVIECKNLFKNHNQLLSRNLKDNKPMTPNSLKDDNSNNSSQIMDSRPNSTNSNISKLNLENKNNFGWNMHAIVSDDENKQNLKKISLEKLPEINKRITNKPNNMYLDSLNDMDGDGLHEHFIKALLKPNDWNKGLDSNFMFSSEYIIHLCKEVENIIKNQPMVLKIRVPVKIYGDIHGQYSDLMRFFELYDMPSEKVKNGNGDIECNDQLFLGDQVDRGTHSLETVCLLFALKIKYPTQIHLLRGNHEDRFINQCFGFAEECRNRLNEDPDDEDSVFNMVNNVFDQLPMAAVIEDRICCLHGGIGSTLNSMDDIIKLQRPLEVIHDVQDQTQQLVVDILWSDPTDNDDELGIQANCIRDPQGSGNIVKFGPDRVKAFLEKNKYDYIIRAHECVMDGIERFANGKLITVFSATDQCGRHKNAGGMLHLMKNYQFQVYLIQPQNNPHNQWMQDEEQLKKRPPTPPRWRDNVRNMQVQ